ncbi:hypothetical protein JF66_15290 [Cryobacterium sp. MLB-32]|uniref:hypothetical protein n=1 Tax=Cryobacterium sp. MLB-32 TaxID=1529318 RepID=UPI0004E68381|nr:hypothetical protein [Cryobacterium sp. MLB-32]KFF58871.1 hypothetical protein JF66_15290 [Cryobacterium sp. MLB-32]
MSLSPLHIVVSGTAGGVGTTTLTALLFDLLSAPAGVPSLADHTSGTLAPGCRAAMTRTSSTRPAAA